MNYKWGSKKRRNADSECPANADKADEFRAEHLGHILMASIKMWHWLKFAAPRQ